MNIEHFSNIKNPCYTSELNSEINITCDIAGVGDGILFTASQNDVMDYGRALYLNAVNGDYGDVAAFIPYVESGPLLQTQKINVTELAIKAFAIQCAVDAGTATDEQKNELASIKLTIAKSVGKAQE